MKTKIMKPLIRGGFILLCLSILGSLLSSSSVLAQEPNKKSGELEEGDSVSIPFEIKVGEMVQGELECEEALEVTIFIPALEKSVDFGEIVGSFFYAAETEGRRFIRIGNTTGRTTGYTLTYTVLPTNLAPGTYSGPGVKGGELGSNFSDSIPFEIKVGEMVQGELASKEALRVIILDPTLRESVDFGKIIVESFFYAAETEGTYHIKITNPTKETIVYTLSYTVLPTSLAPGTHSGPGIIRRNWPAIIFGVLAVGGITYYIFILRPKKKRKLERTRDAFRKRIKRTE